jgi:hypothetical protein
MARNDGNERVYVDREDRTFETRLQFIADIFSSKYERHQIMASCITYKLDKSYEAYFNDILKSVWNLNGKDPIKILKRIDK